MTRKWFGAAVAAITCAVALVGISAPVFAGQATPAPKMAPKAPATKKLPPRNAKGQFMKATPGKVVPAKKLPPRDAQGHFMKMPAAPTTKMTPKMAPKPTTTKKLPPRNSKGQFMKASPSPVAPKK